MEKDKLMLKDIYCVIVLYNKSIEQSITFNCLKNIDGINIIVCDNSTKDFNNESSLKNSNFTYINMHGNKGLSKAYNAAINCLKGKSGFLCLFDDDTFLKDNYFNELLKENFSADVFLPKIYDEIGILSPCKFNGLRVKRIKDLSELNNQNITGINSGMAINLDIFKEYRYNENYFLDYIDHDFLRTMKLKNKKIKILNVKLNQRFSGNDNSNLNAAVNRFRIYKKDFKYFYNKNFKSKIFASVSLFKRLVCLTLKFKSLKFLASSLESDINKT